MRHVATLHFTEPLVRRAVLSFWKRSVGWKMFAALVLCAGGFVLLVQSGDRTWSVGVLGTALLFALLFLAMLYVVHLRQALRKLRALRDPVATFVAEDGSFTMTSDVGSSTFVWSTVHDVWKFKDYWLLLFSRAQFVTLPVADMPADMQAYVLERVGASKSMESA